MALELRRLTFDKSGLRRPNAKATMITSLVLQCLLVDETCARALDWLEGLHWLVAEEVENDAVADFRLLNQQAV